MSESTPAWDAREPMPAESPPRFAEPAGSRGGYPLPPQPSADYPQQQPLGGYPQSGGYPQPGSPMTGPPPNNVGWAVASLLFFWPLAFSAFTHSAKVFPLWMTGDPQGALAASERAKSLGKISLFLAVGLFVLLIVFYVVALVAIIGTVNNTTTS